MQLSTIMLKKSIYILLLIIAIAFGYYQYSKYKMAPTINIAELRLFNLDNSTYTLFENNQKFAYLVFWGTWCGPCVREMPIIEKVYNEMPNAKNWNFVTIAEEPEEVIQNFKSRKPYTISFTISEKEFSEYNIFTYPTSFIINNKGEILESWTGDIRSKEELINILSKHQ